MRFFALIAALAATVLAAPKSTLVTRDSRDSPEIPAIDDKEFIDLLWNATLAQMALDDIRKCTKDVEHLISANTSYRGGSNLSGAGPSPSKRDAWIETAREMVHGWHEEEMFYDYSTRQTKNVSHQVYHFSQLVWRDSSQLGCAVMDCTDTEGIKYPGRLYCYYDPIGNNVAANFFAENVWPPICADPSKAELEARFGY